MPIDSDVSSGYSSSTGSSSSHTSYATSGSSGSSGSSSASNSDDNNYSSSSSGSSNADVGPSYTIAEDASAFDSIYGTGPNPHDASETDEGQSIWDPSFYAPTLENDEDESVDLVQTRLSNNQTVFVDTTGLTTEALTQYQQLRETERERTDAARRLAESQRDGVPSFRANAELSLTQAEAEVARDEREAFETAHFGIDHRTITSSGVHTALDVAGMTEPFGIVADGANAALYAVEGEWVDAGISIVGAVIPAGGALITAARLSDRAIDAATRIDGTIEGSYKYADGSVVHLARHADGTTSNIVERADGSLVFTRVETVNGRMPINSGYAGRTHPSGVQFNERGYPDFTPFAREQVELPSLTGDRRKDSRLANEEAGYTKTPKGYVWHHVEDGRTMQLVPEELHDAARHTGGVAIVNSRGY